MQIYQEIYQPRQNFKEEKLEELAKSMEKWDYPANSSRPSKSNSGKFKIVAGKEDGWQRKGGFMKLKLQYWIYLMLSH